MFRHVVLFEWNASASAARRQDMTDALARLPAAIPEIRDYRMGADAGINPGNAEFAIVADFDDRDGYLAYRDHPVHRDVITRLITPIVAARHAVQYEF